MKRTTPARKAVAAERKRRTASKAEKPKPQAQAGKKEDELGNRRDQSHTPNKERDEIGIESKLPGSPSLKV
jgi:hypothetical protein